MGSHAERRLITCLFVDVVGSTDLTARLGPERMKRALEEAFGKIRDIMIERGGTIEKYAGDAVLVLFGVPVSHTDDPERALRAGEACALRARQTDPHDFTLTIRVGIETGDALVDMEAVGAQRQQMAIGTCVNVAARLQQAAEPGEVVVGPGCHEATAHVAEFESLGPRQLKGLGALPVWKLLHVVGARPGPPLPFVGRREELERLRSAYAQARDGRATLALVFGPPGQGKTRLVEEFVGGVRSNVHLLEARCRPGGEIGSWTPLKQLLSGDVPEATAEAVSARVDALIDDLDERARVATPLCHSAGLLVDGRLLTLGPFERDQEVAYAWQRYLWALGRERPVVLWIENVHWGEPHLVRLVDRLTLGVQMPLLVLMTGRPEFAGTTVLRPTEDRVFLEMERLDPASAVALGRSAGATDDRAIERADGHPLFIIELARSRRVSDGELPLTVQAAIGARLDELAPSDREILQRAAVIGETFTVRDATLLGERDPAEVTGTLARLAHLRYLHPLGQAYRFHHILVRDLAYARLPVAERMRLHARYAQEAADPEDAEELAHHWWEALHPPDAEWVWEGAPEREQMRRVALHAHLAAGRRLSDRFERERALEIYRRVLALARDQIEVAEIETAIGFAYARDGLGDEAWEHRLRAIAAYRQAGATPPATLYGDLLEPPTQRWGFFRTLPPEGLVVRLLQEGLQVARMTQDTQSLARLLVQHAHFAPYDPAIANEALRQAEMSPDPRRFAEVFQYAAAVFIQAGKPELAGAAYERMDRLVEAGGRITDELDALMWRALLAFIAGDLARADALADRLLAASASSNVHWRTHAKGTKGLVLLGRGDWSGVEEIARDTDALVTNHPGVPFCLIAAAASAYGATAGLLARKPLPDALPAFVERCVPESAPVRASLLLLPHSMTGRGTLDPLAFESWRPHQRLWDRQVWDPMGVTLAIALTMLDRWDDLEAPLRHLEEVAHNGGRFCGALASAIREEMTAAAGGPRPTHTTLRDLGYVGLSELLSFQSLTRS